LVFFFPSYPRLAPLRQAQGRLWAAFFRRYAAAFVLGSPFSTGLYFGFVMGDLY
jgi:hypothetical protein